MPSALTTLVKSQFSIPPICLSFVQSSNIYAVVTMSAWFLSLLLSSLNLMLFIFSTLSKFFMSLNMFSDTLIVICLSNTTLVILLATVDNSNFELFTCTVLFFNCVVIRAICLSSTGLI